MNRSVSTQAIVLRNNRIGDIHKGVVLLTPEEGLVRAIAHGAYSHRGKLRGTTNFLCTGTAYLYHDPVRNSTKLTDMDVAEYFSGTREDVRRFFTASLWAECIIKTHALGGDAGRLYELFIEALQELDRRPGDESELVSVHFVWRFLRVSGMQPDLYHCAISGEFLAESSPIYFSASDQGFCSADYATDHMPAWQPGAAAFMRHTDTLSLPLALRVTPPDGALARIKRVLYTVLQEHVESPLNSLATGGGIL